MGASFRVNQMSVHAEMARDRRNGWTDGWTDGFLSLYSRRLYSRLKWVWKCTVNCVKLCNHVGLDQVNTASMI